MAARARAHSLADRDSSRGLAHLVEVAQWPCELVTRREGVDEDVLRGRSTKQGQREQRGLGRRDRTH